MKTKKLSLERKMRYTGYGFVFPLIIGMAFIYVPVLVQSFLYSISEITIDENGLSLAIRGFYEYHKALLVDPGNLEIMFKSVGSMLIDIPLVIVFSFLLANLLNRQFPGRTVIRAIFFLPVIIATGVISVVESGDLINSTYMSSGIGGVEFDVLMNSFYSAGLGDSFINLITAMLDKMMQTISSLGIQLLIFLAALQSIPASMFEAARVEGATSWEITWKITFPYISPLILVNVVYTIIDSFYNNNNAAVNMIFAIQKVPARYAYASALSWIYLVIVLAFLGLAYLIIKRFIVYRD